MIDKERIAKVIGDIQEFLTKIKQLNLCSEEDFKKDWRNLHTAAMLLFSAVNRSIDLAQEVVTGKEFGFPSTYQDHFYLLYQNKVISKKLFDDFSYLIKVRNLIAHEYYRFTLSEIFKATQVTVVIVPVFVKEVKKAL